MKKYHVQNRAPFVGAIFCVFLANTLAVILQFFKGNVLDHAIRGELKQTYQYALLLFFFILGEVLLFYLYKRLSARYVVSATKTLKQDIFAAILARSYPSF